MLLPEVARTVEDVNTFSAKSWERSLNTIKKLAVLSSLTGHFYMIHNSAKFGNLEALSQAPLIGLARVIYSAEAKTIGGLINVEDAEFAMQAPKYVPRVDVVKTDEGLPCNARLRPFVAKEAETQTSQYSFHLRPHGIYVFTSGLRCLGLEVPMSLSDKGAKPL